MSGSAAAMHEKPSATDLLRRADALREKIGGERFRDELVAALYRRAEEVVAHSVRRRKPRAWLTDEAIDSILTHPVLGIPVMSALFAAVFWITIVAANVPSGFLAGLLMADGGLTEWLREYVGVEAPAWLASSVYQLLHQLFAVLRAPAWLSGFVVDGVYLGLAWVVSVMRRPWRSSFPYSPCSKISATCRASLSISTGSSSEPARTESRRSP
jgi:ferrous iron transport protein B